MYLAYTKVETPVKLSESYILHYCATTLYQKNKIFNPYRHRKLSNYAIYSNCDGISIQNTVKPYTLLADSKTVMVIVGTMV